MRYSASEMTRLAIEHDAINLSQGFPDFEGPADVLEADLDQFLGRADAKTRRNDDKLDEALRRVVRQTAQTEIGKKPEVTVVISRIS